MPSSEVAQFSGGPWHNRTVEIPGLPPEYRVPDPPRSVFDEASLHIYRLEYFGIAWDWETARWPVYYYTGEERRL